MRRLAFPALLLGALALPAAALADTLLDNVIGVTLDDLHHADADSAEARDPETERSGLSGRGHGKPRLV